MYLPCTVFEPGYFGHLGDATEEDTGEKPEATGVCIALVTVSN
jgi:hypothetical protein